MILTLPDARLPVGLKILNPSIAADAGTLKAPRIWTAMFPGKSLLPSNEISFLNAVAGSFIVIVAFIPDLGDWPTADRKSVV